MNSAGKNGLRDWPTTEGSLVACVSVQVSLMFWGTLRLRILLLDEHM